jgi:acetyl esterase/lipase
MIAKSETLYAVREIRDQVFSQVGGHARLADLYIPENCGTNIPIIVWLHGGGWRFGDRKMAPDLKRFFAERGFAMVSFDYRLSDEAKFPAPIEDTKTLIRWLRSIADQHDLNASQIGLWGSSAGAHIAACAALTGEEKFVTGEHAGFPSSVQAVVDGYGPTDFSRIDRDRLHAPSTPADVESVSVPNLLPAGDPESFESRFLGETVTDSSQAVNRANPVTYVNSDAPPFLILHGKSDPLMPWQQSQILFEALEKAGTIANLVLIERLGHGFFNRSDLDSVAAGTTQIFASSREEAQSFAMELKESPFGFGLVEEFFRRNLKVR